MAVEEVIRQLVARARVAQEEYATFNQEEVDRVVKVLARTVFNNAEELARLAVEETRMGCLEDKIKKNKNKARIIWNNLRNKKSVGIINKDPERGIIEIARPMGVVGVVTPCTNPIVTPMCNAMFALKGRNAVIFSPHPRALRCMQRLMDMWWEELELLGVPANLLQVLPECSLEMTQALMRQVDVIVATGGAGMVKAAYSSGKPALGVGVGNVVCIIDNDVNLKEAIAKIVLGKAFDYGIICSSEQSVLVPEPLYEASVQEFCAQGAFYLEDEGAIGRLLQVMFQEGVINRAIVGQTIQKIGAMAGLDIPADRRLILVRGDGIGPQYLLCREKMSPVLTIYTYQNFSQAVEMARAILQVEGRGHSVSVHSNNPEHIEDLGLKVEVCRVLVNQPCATHNGGSFENGLTPTTSLGCGSWGGNSISENLDYKHLINISRIAYPIANPVIPSDEELWGE
ncbi:MAG: succinate-semialdehyde dehydrogenase [Clostridia bacterium]|nr:succinate-semialdehyde dehydrogenase [Clostridia bacterium]